ncbi:MAG: hypothetical protein U1E73_06745 [Planctomycetota bacterium]
MSLTSIAAVALALFLQEPGWQSAGRSTTAAPPPQVTPKNSVVDPVDKQDPPPTAPQGLARPAPPDPLHLKNQSPEACQLLAVLNDPDLVLFDQPATDGTWWIRAAGYKAHLAADGWTFIAKPLPGASDLSPITFRLARATAGATALAVHDAEPRRADHRFEIEHGDVVQRLDVGGKGIAQSFLFAALPNRQELVLETAITTRLVGSAAGTGLEFRGPHDRVTYSGAVAIDASGERVDCPTTLEGDRIVIRVPARFLEHAQLPLLIDPQVGFGVPTTSTNGDLGDPDIAAGVETIVALPNPPYNVDRWMVVWAHYFGGNDWDCYVGRMDQNLVGTGVFVVDFTTDGWQRPRIAGMGALRYFMVVAQVRSGASPQRVSGRILLDDLNPVTSQFVIASSAVDSLRPDVGGDGGGQWLIFRGGYFTVVWEHAYSATDHDVFARQVAPNGTLQAMFVVEGNAQNQTNPSISKSNGAVEINAASTQRYTIVYQSTSLNGDEDIYGAMLTWDGLPVLVNGSSRFPIDTSTANDTFPQVSSPTYAPAPGVPGRRILAVYQRNTNNSDIAATCFDGTGAILARANISVLENAGVRLGWPQYRPSVDSDGYRFGVAYHEVYQGNTTVNDLDTRMSLVACAGNALMVEEAGTTLGFSGNREFNVQVASRYSADGPHFTTHRFGTTNDRDNTNNTFAIDLRTYDGTPAVSINYRSTGCGGIQITASGTTSLGSTVTFTTSPALPLVGMLVGFPANTPVGGCAGCTLGASGATVIGTTMTQHLPSQVTFIGLPISAQAFGFDLAGGPCFGQLHLSDTVDVVVQ